MFALEHLGRELVLVLDGPSRERLRVLVEPEFQARVGDQLFLRPDPARCLMFERESGRRL